MMYIYVCNIMYHMYIYRCQCMSNVLQRINYWVIYLRLPGLQNGKTKMIAIGIRNECSTSLQFPSVSSF